MTADRSTESFLRLSELSQETFDELMNVSAVLAAAPDLVPPPPSLSAVAFINERRSVRTRVATFMAARKLGVEFLDLPWEMFHADPARRHDHACFVAHELRSLVDLGCRCLVARISDHALLELWRSVGAISIVNGCSDVEHPLQGLADVLTLTQRFGSVAGLRLTFVGNGSSPVLSSLVALSRLAGLEIRVVGPHGYEPTDETLNLAGLRLEDVWSPDPRAGLEGADAVYADEAFYREPTEAEATVFSPYKVTHALLDRHCPSAVVMHCLPHGDEVEERVLERPTSLVRMQVRNRIPVTAAVLANALGL